MEGVLVMKSMRENSGRHSVVDQINLYGCCIVSEGTLRPQDLIPKYLSALEDVAPEVYQQAMVPSCGFPLVPHHALDDSDSEWWNSDECSSVLNELSDLLNEHAPSDTYFGSNEGDGACIGFWTSEDQG
jgi:hypothetical protein